MEGGPGSLSIQLCDRASAGLATQRVVPAGGTGTQGTDFGPHRPLPGPASPPGPRVSGCQGEGPAWWGATCWGGQALGDRHSRSCSLSEEAEAHGPRPGPMPDPAVPDFSAALFSLVTCHLHLPQAWVAGLAFLPLRGDVTPSFPGRDSRARSGRPWGGAAPDGGAGGEEVASARSGGDCAPGTGAVGARSHDCWPHPPWNRGRKICVSFPSLSSLN